MVIRVYDNTKSRGGCNNPASEDVRKWLGRTRVKIGNIDQLPSPYKSYRQGHVTNILFSFLIFGRFESLRKLI